MKPFKLMIILSMILGCSARLNTIESMTRMIVDVIKSRDGPTAVVAKVCWGMFDKMQLATELMNTNDAKTINLADNLNIDKYTAYDMLIVMDLNCTNSEQLLTEAAKNKKFKKPYRWLLLADGREDVIPRELKNLTILIDSDIIVAYGLENEVIRLNMVYRIDSTSDFIIEAFGTWTSSTGLEKSKEANITTSVRRKNLKRKPIIMSVVSVNDIAKAKAELYNLNNIVTDNIAKSSFHNIIPLYVYMNATIEIILTDTWGYYINNTWNGMVGQIQRGEAELCGCSARLNTIESMTRMIVDVIKSRDGPTAVVAKVCWGMFDKMQLATELMNTNDAKTINLADNLNIDKYTAYDMLIVMDLNCTNSEQLLTEAAKNKKFKKPYRWLLLADGREDVIPRELKNLTILIDSDIIVAYGLENEVIRLNMVYRIDSTSDFIIEAFGTWTSSTGLEKSKEANITTSVRRKNLKRKPIIMSVVSVNDIAKAKAELYNLNNIVTDNIAKSSFHNIIPLYVYMNATIEIILTDTWGYYINNTWNGMVGQIQRGEAELCGTVMLMRIERAEILQFVTQPIHSKASFVFRSPPLSLQNNLFVLPFKSTVWICIGCLIVLLVFILYANAKWERAKKGEAKCEEPMILRPHISDIAIFVVGAVVQQGGNCQLKGFLGRVVTFIMFLTFLFLYTSYSANIVALLQSSSDQIRTLSDLLSSKLELGVEDQPYTRYFFSMATDPVRKAIYEDKVARTGYKPNFMPIDEGVRKIRNTDAPFAFHMNLGLGYKFVEQYFQEHEKCGLREIDYIPNNKPWLSCRKESPYKEIFKIGLSRVFEHGLGQRVNRLIYNSKPPCTSRGGNFGSVNMMDFHPVILCLLYGMIASVLLLVLEILVFKMQVMKATERLVSSSYSDSVDG